MPEYLDAFLAGKDICIFTYGQTATGGSYSVIGTKDQPGVLPRFLTDLFDRLQNLSEVQQNSVQISFYELYSNKVYDLSKGDSEALKLVADENGRVSPIGAKITSVLSYEDAIEHFEVSMKNRRGCSASTMNMLADKSNLVYCIDFLMRLAKPTNASSSLSEDKRGFQNLEESRKKS
eukprot:CAMPEP_0168328728 /NCGR_PEP_ID=MMETSP0213-20121227/6679_1 /TAXON_ID=151035 /ORGANISM="Euplotes harpa, Strain FSP1.4" /LENGTH=176 /DNA_ID=CAMNT_0008331905 /DNA_START=203 /DNA_END=734 /DNA_ORIENTATION=+